MSITLTFGEDRMNEVMGMGRREHGANLSNVEGIDGLEGPSRGKWHGRHELSMPQAVPIVNTVPRVPNVPC